MGGVVGLFACGAAPPQSVGAGLFQHRLGALGADRDCTLGISHPGLQHVAQAELDGIETEFVGDLVHHQFGRRHRFQCAVAARRAAVDGARRDGGSGHIGLWEIVGRPERRRAHPNEEDGDIRAAPAVGNDPSPQRLEQTCPALDRHGVVHAELVPFQASLELLEPIVGEPHRPAVAVDRGDEAVVRHGAAILRAVADGKARVHEQPLQTEAAPSQHLPARRAPADAGLVPHVRRRRSHDDWFTSIAAVSRVTDPAGLKPAAHPLTRIRMMAETATRAQRHAGFNPGFPTRIRPAPGKVLEPLARAGVVPLPAVRAHLRRLDPARTSACNAYAR